MLKWLVLALIILFGSLFPEVGSDVAHFFGIETLTALSLFILVGILLNNRFKISNVTHIRRKANKKFSSRNIITKEESRRSGN